MSAERRRGICFGLIVCDRAFQSSGAKLEKSSETKHLCCYVSQQHLESVGVAAMVIEGVVQERIGE